MISIENIIGELYSIDIEISTYLVKLQREKGELVNTMNKAQSTFGDQVSGQQLVNSLYRVLQNVVNVESHMNLVRNEIHDSVHNMQK